MKSDLQLVEDRLKRFRFGQAIGTESELRDLLVAEGVKPARAERAIRKALASCESPVFRTRKGELIFAGSDVTIYQRFRLALPDFFEQTRWRIVDEPLHCHSAKGLRGAGDWLYPDLIAHTKSLRTTDSTASDLHVFEVEQINGFNLASVYQAFECGRGANFAWVFFVARKDELATWSHLAAIRDPTIDPDDPRHVIARKRILRAAGERGVGLVAMTSPTRPSEWKVVNEPRRRRSASATHDRALMLKAVTRKSR